MKLAPLILLLERMQIPACERCGRRFMPSAGGQVRFCSSECDRSENIMGRAEPVRRSGRDPEFAGPLPPDVSAAKRSRSSPQRRDEPEFEIVWNGVGPLPGAGGAAGLGSTLSGTRFSIGKRV
jgi:hypothetical protein